MKKIKPSKFAFRAGTLVIGVPNLQDTFDNLRSGGALTLQVVGEGPFLISELVLIAEDKLDRIIAETTEPIDPHTVN